MATCLVSLGSNLGNRRHLIEQAIARIDAHGLIQVTARSRLYETQPIGGPPGQDSFLNAVIRLETSLLAKWLLRFLQETESQLGRVRGERWSARTIDLDLLLYDDKIAFTDELTLPHPRMPFRRFVLEPAAEIAADCFVPLVEKTIREVLHEVKSLPNYVEISGDVRSCVTDFAARLASELSDENGISVHLLKDPAGSDALVGRLESPTGHGMKAAIKLLQQRIKVLDGVNWEDPEVWFVSDFGSHVSFDRKWLDTTDFLVAHCEFIKRTRIPKLEVVLKRKTRGSPDFCNKTMFESIEDLDSALIDVVAAVLAMHDVPRPVT